MHTWFSSNYNVEVHAYVKNGKYCVVNNTYEPQDTTVYTTGGASFALHLEANENPLVQDRLSGAPPGFHGLCPQRLRALRPLQNSRPNRQTPLTIRRRKVKLKEKQGAGP